MNMQNAKLKLIIHFRMICFGLGWSTSLLIKYFNENMSFSERGKTWQSQHGERCAP